MSDNRHYPTCEKAEKDLKMTDKIVVTKKVFTGRNAERHGMPSRKERMEFFKLLRSRSHSPTEKESHVI
jgi:hypothetical protein